MQPTTLALPSNFLYAENEIICDISCKFPCLVIQAILLHIPTKAQIIYVGNRVNGFGNITLAHWVDVLYLPVRAQIISRKSFKWLR